MILTIKTEYKNVYPVKIRDKQLQYVSSALHPTYQCWVFLVVGPDGEFYSLKREHVLRITKLEVALT